MRERAISLIRCCLVAALSVAVAGGAVLARSGRMETPRNFRAALSDDGLVQVDVSASPIAGTRTVAAWSIRNGAEYDIAVAVRDADGVWTDVATFGNDDGVDQRDPALAVDPYGNVYLAYGASDGSITLRVANSDGDWQSATRATPSWIEASRPSLQFFGGRLILAFLVDGEIEMIDVESGAGYFTRDFEDGPDPVENQKESPGPDTDKDDEDATPVTDGTVGGIGPNSGT